MPHFNSLSLENVRCFKDVQIGKLSPITLLIGENSTGKSTFLGCFDVLDRIFSDHYMSINTTPDFNVEPFLMGSFKNIIRNRRGNAANNKYFSLETEYSIRATESPLRMKLEFSERGSQPVLTRICFENASKDKITFESRPDAKHEMYVSFNDKVVELDAPLEYIFRIIELPSIYGREGERELKPITDFIQNTLLSSRKPESSKRRRTNGLILPQSTREYVASIAPLRAEQQRTYNPISETTSPKGIHVPMYMMRLARQEKAKWNSLSDDLVEFGSRSNLFSHINVKGHGGDMSDPFQIQVKANSGSYANLMDVGFGVGQSLPILVDIISRKNTTFLMQQPEVHLHPRGQAELGSFFVEQVGRKRNRFLIETHSDYIVNRIGICVRDKRISHKDVSILYFEAKRNEVVVHNIGFDKLGNVEGAPRGYRDFFMDETERYLGI